MPARQQPSERRATALILLGFASLALTFGRGVWADDAAPWWGPFALWLALVGVGVGLARPLAGDPPGSPETEP